MSEFVVLLRWLTHCGAKIEAEVQMSFLIYKHENLFMRLE